MSEQSGHVAACDDEGCYCPDDTLWARLLGDDDPCAHGKDWAGAAFSSSTQEPRRRGRGSRFTQAECPTCDVFCNAPDTSPDAQRMWAKRHADRTGHRTLVQTTATRSYYPTEGDHHD